MFLVDSNVLLDIVKKDPRWGAWSEKSLAQAMDSGPIAINQLIYAEVSVAYERCEQIDGIVDAFEVAKLFLPWDAAFLAGRSVLPRDAKTRRNLAAGREIAWKVPDLDQRLASLTTDQAGDTFLIKRKGGY